ncbi:MAG: Protein translocase subunit SecY [Parcubacteria group bacterium GW2011_GWF2_38_76]|nr:MAG: Protein translocase subunit SecY [Parcubacteria group bacterium GW2011_GWF2_38_76]HBM45898.1 preprotein translocase subunit SecY [Patescibacteria group bacterium]
MSSIWNKIKLALGDRDLRSKILFVLFALILFRLGATIPVPGVDRVALEKFFSGSQFFGLMDIFSGGGLSNLSIFMLGVGPYITASIIMQLLTMIFPKMKEMYQEAGSAGKLQFAQYSRLLSVPLAFLQGFSFLTLLGNQGVLLANATLFDKFVMAIVITAGSTLLMWIGELITEYGIGNGLSLIIFSGIVARIPSLTSELAFKFDVSQIPTYLGFLVVAIVIVAGVVVISEAERPIPVTYAKRVRGNKVYGGTSTYLPLRVNQAGVIPIIFALSFLLFPQMILNFMLSLKNETLTIISDFLLSLYNNQFIYGSLYFLLVVLFTYFYTAVTFDPDSISSNLQKSGAFIPGIRPGVPTTDYLNTVLVRLTLVGSVFLGFIAILPLIMTAAMGDSSLAIGGTALLIVVSVVLELVRQIDAQVSMREY